MYEETINGLKTIVNNYKGRLSPWMRVTIAKAADAIDELELACNRYEKDYKSLCEYLPKWIPVTERLPNGEAERYLVAAPLMSHGLRVSICYYADNLEEVDEYDFKDEKHSGFFGYDDEYGYYEKSGVKYWMPLPTPPKED